MTIAVRLIPLVLSIALMSPALARADTLTLLSATSVKETGLMDVLLDSYRKWTHLKNIKVEAVSLPSAKAFETAMRGEADVLFVHDRDKEEKFMDEGYGYERHEVMYDDHVLIGPASDPAKIKSAVNPAVAFRRICYYGAPFITRGESSETYTLENRLWRAANLSCALVKGMVTVNKGMADALKAADEKGAYILADKATYLAFRDSVKGLAILYECDSVLLDQYSVIAVNPAKFPNIRYRQALDFIKFITGPAGQTVIARFRDGHGNPLFFPNAKKQ